SHILRNRGNGGFLAQRPEDGVREEEDREKDDCGGEVGDPKSLQIDSRHVWLPRSERLSA
ncbi:hypothetical protein U1Q18_032525, partial [Sarracenia purpurea var. burkii]